MYTPARRGGKTMRVVASIAHGTTVYCGTAEMREHLSSCATRINRDDIRFVVGEGDPQWVSVIDVFRGLQK